MKIKINDKEILELTEVQEKVIKTYILDEEYENDIINAIIYVISERYNYCFKKIKEEWDKKLEEEGIAMIPTNKDEYAKLVFAHPDYKSRSQKENKI